MGWTKSSDLFKESRVDKAAGVGSVQQSNARTIQVRPCRAEGTGKDKAPELKLGSAEVYSSADDCCCPFVHVHIH